jgi:hypothetical protein
MKEEYCMEQESRMEESRMEELYSLVEVFCMEDEYQCIPYSALYTENGRNGLEIIHCL